MKIKFILIGAMLLIMAVSAQNTPPTTTIIIDNPTTTIDPFCGNMIIETGEECDDQSDACNGGHGGDWNCINCKCIPMTADEIVSAKRLDEAGLVNSTRPIELSSSSNKKDFASPRIFMYAFALIFVGGVMWLWWTMRKERMMEKTNTKKPKRRI